MAFADINTAASNATAISHLLYDAHPHLDTLGGQARFEELIKDFKFGEERRIHRLAVKKGIPYREEIDCEQLAESKNVGGAKLAVFFLPCRPRKQISLAPDAFSHLLQACDVPHSYLEVLANNNGLYNAYSLRGVDGSPTDYYLMVKFPFGPFSNGSLYMHHSIAIGSTTCIVMSTRAQILAERLFDVFRHAPKSTDAKTSHSHPFIPVAVLIEHFRIGNDDDRNDIDQSVCRIENRSGVSLHNFGSRTRAKISEYALLQRELHMQDALIVMAEHCFSFHARFAEFLVDEEQKFAKVLERRDKDGGVVSRCTEKADFVRACLNLNASMSTWTLKQLHALEKRLKVQLRVIDSTISATDALTMIRLARASQVDSNTMKAITILTMVFLPATFVCSLFGTGFFSFGVGDDGRFGDRKIQVVGQFWVYFAVTVPLTIVVLGVCAAWLKWSGQWGDEDNEKAGGSERKFK